MSLPIVLGFVGAGIAALAHVAFFLLETVLFERRAVRRLFGVRQHDESPSLRLFAANQGVYNLALAVVVLVGLVLLGGGSQVGLGLAIAALTVMVVAALALVVSSPRLWRGAVVQGVPAAVGLVGLIGLLP